MDTTCPSILPAASLTSLSNELLRMIVDHIFKDGWWLPPNPYQKTRRSDLDLRLVSGRFDGLVVRSAYRHVHLLARLDLRIHRAIQVRLMVEKVKTFHTVGSRQQSGAHCLPETIYSVSLAAAHLSAGANYSSDISDDDQYGRFARYLALEGNRTEMQNYGNENAVEEEEQYTSSDSDVSVMSDGAYCSLSGPVRRDRELRGENLRTQDERKWSLDKVFGSTNDPRSSRNFDYAKWMNEDVLIAASAVGDTFLCRRLLTDVADVNFTSFYFGGAIHAAVSQGHEHVVQLLLERNDLDVNQEDIHMLQKPLVMAAMRGYEAIVNLFLSMRADVHLNEPDIYGFTALRWACRRGHEGIVRLMLGQSGTDVNYAGDWNRKIPLEEAASTNHETIVRLLLQHPGIDIRAGDGNGRYSLLDRLLLQRSEPTHSILQLLVDHDPRLLKIVHPEQNAPLWIAAVDEPSIPNVRFLMSQDSVSPQLNKKGKHTMLHELVSERNEPMVRELLRWDKLDPNFRGSQRLGMTPLHLATCAGHYDMVRVLLEHREVDVNSVNKYGQTPLAQVISTIYPNPRNRDLMVKLLLSREDICADQQDYRGQTPLHQAAADGCAHIARLLLAREDVNPDTPAVNGTTPLFQAAYEGAESIVRLLLDREGVNPDSPANGGRTPLLVASSWRTDNDDGSEEIVRLLLARSDVNGAHRDNKGRDAFFAAGRRGDVRMMRALLDGYPHLFDANLRDREGRTVLHHLAQSEGLRRAVAAVEYLLERKDVDVNMEDNSGKTALGYAVEFGNDPVAQLLSDGKYDG